MNYLIEPLLKKRKTELRPTPGRNPQICSGRSNSMVYADSADAYSLRDISLPWEILEAAYYLFQKNGFEGTAVTDVCTRLDIKHSQFYNHFDSLDEVLEILWAR